MIELVHERYTGGTRGVHQIGVKQTSSWCEPKGGTTPGPPFSSIAFVQSLLSDVVFKCNLISNKIPVTYAI